MPNLSIKNMPTDTYRKLKQSAKRNHRSLNKEAVFRLEIGLSTSTERSPAEVREIIKSARKLRRKMAKEGVLLTNEEITKAKNEGRP